jgi:uncharacterized protein DUF881
VAEHTFDPDPAPVTRSSRASSPVGRSGSGCVGNTLLLHDHVFSPPFDMRAIGAAARVQGTLEAGPGVGALRDAADAYHLGFPVKNQDDTVASAHVGALSLDRPSAVR